MNILFQGTSGSVIVTRLLRAIIPVLAITIFLQDFWLIKVIGNFHFHIAICLILSCLFFIFITSYIIILISKKVFREANKSEAALLESEEKYRSLAETNNDFIIRYDKKCRHLYLNNAGLRLLGFESKAIIGKTHREAGFDEKQSDFWEKKINLIINTKKSYNIQYQWDSMGSSMYLDCMLTPEFDNYGNVKSVLSVSRNITQFKKNEDELRVLSRAIEQNPATIIITNIQGVIEYVNPKFSELTGYSLSDVVGKTPRILKSGNTTNKTYKELWDTITSGEEWRGEFINKKKNGEEYFESALISPIFDENDKVTHFLAVKEDITEKKNLKKDLTFANDKAEESDRLKSAFLANMSHEIRTPMNAIQGFSELLTRPSISDADRIKYAGIIHSRSVYLLSLIEDIIDISKVEAGIIQINKVIFPINDLLDELYNQYTEKLKGLNKNVKLLISRGNPDKNFTIYSDKNRIRQVLINLVDNAIKFTSHGTICMEYSISKNEDIEFSVADTGVGIASKNQQLIFERFHQTNDYIILNYGGLGLGLSICKGIVNILGGKIWVESEVGKGSNFKFSIPTAYIESKEKELQHPKMVKNEILKSGYIMLVEDDIYSVELFQNTLKDFHVLVAQNGNTALKLFHQYSDIKLILMDIGLPDISGLEVTQKIRTINAIIPIIALTAFAGEDDRLQCKASGCNEFIPKPVDSEVLLQKINSYFI
jgi:PAS domain S-box-containing protein